MGNTRGISWVHFLVIMIYTSVSLLVGRNCEKNFKKSTNVESKIVDIDIYIKLQSIIFYLLLYYLAFFMFFCHLLYCCGSCCCFFDSLKQPPEVFYENLLLTILQYSQTKQQENTYSLATLLKTNSSKGKFIWILQNF